MVGGLMLSSQYISTLLHVQTHAEERGERTRLHPCPAVRHQQTSMREKALDIDFGRERNKIPQRRTEAELINAGGRAKNAAFSRIPRKDPIKACTTGPPELFLEIERDTTLKSNPATVERR